MISVNKKEAPRLFIGDVICFLLALWFTLGLRFQTVPSWPVFMEHLTAFGFLFIIWVIVFFIAGLYEKQTVLFKQRLLGSLLNTQIFNSLLAVVFFYFVPYFGITPKTILFIYLVLCFALLFLWRVYGHYLFTSKTPEWALLLGTGATLVELSKEVNSNPRYGFTFVAALDVNQLTNIDFQKSVVQKIKADGISVVVIDLEHKNIENKLSDFYTLLFSQVRFVDMKTLYEEIFDRVPLSTVDYQWFLENVSLSVNTTYDLLKRAVDVAISLLLGVLSLVFYPFIYLAIKLDDQGPIFINQKRIGQHGKLINIKKFRTMSFNDEGGDKAKENHHTKVGPFLRVSRLDELPQLWNVLKGDLSLIGPRPELPAIATAYEKEIPYYNVRHLIKPGLSGWAQLYHTNPPKRAVNVEETKNKLSYDLFYIKNRSLGLDLKIILKTIKTLLSRTGK